MKIPQPRYKLGQKFWTVRLTTTYVPEFKCIKCGETANHLTHSLNWEPIEEEVFAINIHLGPANRIIYGALINSFVSDDHRLERSMFKSKKAAQKAANTLNKRLRNAVK